MNDQSASADHWLELVHQEFAAESDRGAAIAVAAMIDDRLGNMIRERLCEPTTSERSLVDRYDAPLGSFGSRIDGAHQLGLISDYLARDLHLIRTIRHDFAHAPVGSRFDKPPIVDRVAALQRASDYNRRN